MARNRVIRRWFIGTLATALYAFVTPAIEAEQTEVLKAAFVLNFLKFSENPASKPSDTNTLLVVAVIGNDPLANVLQTVLNGKTIHGRKLEIQLFSGLEEWKHRRPPLHIFHDEQVKAFRHSHISMRRRIKRRYLARRSPSVEIPHLRHNIFISHGRLFRSRRLRNSPFYAPINVAKTLNKSVEAGRTQAQISGRSHVLL